MFRLASLLSCLLLAIVPGAGQAAELVVSGGSPPQSYDPAQARDSSVASVSQQLFSGLARLDGRGRPIPDIAASWRKVARGSEWSFTLREGARFSSGAPITAVDVRYSLERRDPSLRAHIIGQREIRVRLPVADQRFPTRVAHPSFGIVAVGTRRFADPTHIPTSGPYRAHELREGNRLRLVLRNDHALAARAFFETLTVRYLSPSAALRQFRAGQLDAAPPGLSYPPRKAANARRLDGHRRLDGAQVSYLYLNTRHGRFQRVSERVQLAAVLNQQELARSGRGDGEVALSAIAPMSRTITSDAPVEPMAPGVLRLGVAPGSKQLAERVRKQIVRQGLRVRLQPVALHDGDMSSSLDGVVAQFWPEVFDGPGYWQQFGGGPESALSGPRGSNPAIPLVRHRPGYLVGPTVRLRYNQLGITDYAAAIPAQPPRSSTVEIPMGVGPLARLEMRILAPDGPRLASFDAYLGDSRGLRRFATEQQALAFAQLQADRLVADGIVRHRQVHPAYGVLRGFSAWHVGPLAAGHRGVIAPVAIDGPLISDFAFSVSVRRAADSPLRYLVGGSRTIVLDSTEPHDWTNPVPPPG